MSRFLKIFALLFLAPVFSQESYPDEAFNALFQLEGNGWNAGDGTISIGLPDGRTIWMFGDSHLNQNVTDSNELPCLFNTRNCLVVQDSQDNLTTLYDESGVDIYGRQFIKQSSLDQKIYWPSSGFIRGESVYLFWNSYEQNASLPLGVSFSGMVIAELDIATLELLEITPLSDPSLEYGMAVINNDADGFHYIYGRKSEGIFRQVYLARCPLGEIYGDWEFFSGDNSWSTNSAESIPILDDVSIEFSVFQCGDGFYLLSQERGFLQCDAGREIYIYTANGPEGPFENRTTIHTIEDQFNGEYPKTYNAQAHPQFTSNDELLVSYNLNKTCPDPCSVNPFGTTYPSDSYRPKFVRVPMLDCITTGIDTELLRDSFSIFPNPVGDELFLLYDETTFHDLRVEIYDIQGTSIYKSAYKNSIDLSSLQAGRYVILISTATAQWSEVLLKTE